MLPELLNDVSLFRLLHQIDQNLAEQCRKAGCPFCRATLHYAPYSRKPRGGPKDIPEKYLKRLSLCCSREECRRRVLPPSCLFMGQKVYWQAVILVAMTLQQRRSDGNAVNQLSRLLSIPRNTLVRWIHHFRDVFPITPQWQRLRGRVNAAVGDTGLPGTLIKHFFTHSAVYIAGLIECLRFLAWGQAE